MLSGETIQRIVFNSSNIVPNGLNNTFQFNVAGQAVNLKNCDIAISQVNIFNSIFNINASLYNNQNFSIIIPYSNPVQYYTLNISLPNGYYQYSDIQNFVENQMILLGAYLVNGSGNNVYYFNLTANSVYYSAEIDEFPVPTSLPSGWSQPSSGLWATTGTTGGHANGLPSVGDTPQTVIPALASSNFSLIVGIKPGTYPATPQTTEYTILSQFTPEIAPVGTILLRCSLCQNPMMQPQDILYSFTFGGTGFGQLLSSIPTFPQWNMVPDQNAATITITLVDQNFNPIQVQDSNTLIVLLLRFH